MPRAVKGRALTDFPRIDPDNLSDRELMLATLRGMEATHACIDGFRSEQGVVNREATEKRHSMSNTIASVQGAVRVMSGKIGKVEAVQEMDSGRIDKLAKAIGTEKPSPGEEHIKPKGILGWNGWTVVGASGGLLVLYKIIEPLLEPAFRAINHAIMAAQ